MTQVFTVSLSLILQTVPLTCNLCLQTKRPHSQGLSSYPLERNLGTGLHTERLVPKSRPLVSADLQSLQKRKQKVQGAPQAGNDWSIEVLIGESFFPILAPLAYAIQFLMELQKYQFSILKSTLFTFPYFSVRS